MMMITVIVKVLNLIRVTLSTLNMIEISNNYCARRIRLMKRTH
jgi:hypothetical protein